jgi:hypothetical protein
MKRLLIAAAFVATAGPAFAADLPQAVAVPYSKAPVVIDPGVNWTGFYVGAMGADSDLFRPGIPMGSRPPFRFEAGHHSEMKPAAIPINFRPGF